MKGRGFLLTLLAVFVGQAQTSAPRPFSVLAPIQTMLPNAQTSNFTIGDFNGDGKLDLAYTSGASPGSGTLYMALGRGDGTFSSPVAYPTLVAINDFFVVDFNRDGKPDLVAVRVSTGEVGAFLPGQIAVLLGNGDGTFQTSRLFTAPGGSLVLSDLNQDGKLDLISGYSVMLGNGDGTFSGPANLNTILTTYVNDSPGDRFLAVGVPATGHSTQVVGYPTNAIFATQPITVTAPLGFSSGESSLATAFGINLAPTTEAATGVPYPTTLGGIRLHLGDELAPLLYVSPTQIKYLTSAGPYSGINGNIQGPLVANPAISIERVGSPFVAKGLGIPMAVEAPSLFTINSSGLAAATAVRVAPDGTQTPVPVFDCSTGTCVAVPVETHGDPVYLSRYGTGFDYSPSFGTALQATCDGAAPLYLGRQGTYTGLYQINLKLPRRLAPFSSPAKCC